MEGQQANLSVQEAADEYLAHLKQRVKRKQMQPLTYAFLLSNFLNPQTHFPHIRKYNG